MTMLSAILMSVVCLAAGADGQVVDVRTGRPVAGAVVTIAGARGAARTDADGRFTWPDLPPPPLVVVVILPDGRAARAIRIDAVDPTAGLRLEVDLARSETVTVRGTAPGIDVAPGSSSVSVTSADIDLRHPLTLGQALEEVPGVSTISEGQGATPAIRGLARGRTLILVDGARVSAERGAGASGSFLDPGTIARIDVARGPGSVAYGTDAFGGVIAARTRRPPVAGSFDARLAVTVGAGMPERRADVELSRGYGRGGVLFGARARRFENYTSPQGEVPHSSWGDAGIRILWDHAGAGGRWSAGWQSDQARDIHRPRSDSNMTVVTSPFERSHRLTLSFARATLGGWRSVRADAFVGRSEQRVEQDRLPAPGRTRRLDRADSEANDLQTRLTGRRTAGPVRLLAGADIQGRFGLSSTDTAFLHNVAGALTSTVTTQSIASAHRTALGVFAEGDVSVSRWMRVSAGVRGDATRSVNEGGFFGNRSIPHQDVAATGAVTAAPTQRLVLTAQVARGFRDPTLTDRFSRGPVGRGFLEGNPDLVPETSRQFDVTARYDLGRVDLGAAWYRYGITDLVERYLAAPDLFRMRNRGHARLEGIELDARVEAGPGLTLDLTATTSRGRDTTDATPLDDIAPGSVGAAARHVWRQRLSSYVRVTAVSGHRHAGPSEVSTPGYTLVDAAAAWRVSGMVDVRATLRNALEASYYSSAGPRGVWAPGRQLALTVVLSRRRPGGSDAATSSR